MTNNCCFILSIQYVVGAYMLLDSFEAVPGVSAQLRSPLLTPSSGCLDLNFYYYLYGTSTTMELSVHTITAGKRLNLCPNIDSMKVWFGLILFLVFIIYKEAMDLLFSL